MEYLPIILLTVAVILILVLPKPDQKPKKPAQKPAAKKPKAADEYDSEGYNRQGRYNRIYNIKCYRKSDYSEEGFLDIREHPLFLTDHARERMTERLGLRTTAQMEKQALLAYQYGKSKGQLMKSQQAILEEKEAKHNCVMLLYKGYYYAFTENNGLKTVYKNDAPWS